MQLLVYEYGFFGRLIMFVKKLDGCAEFVAGDNSILREMLHPEKDEQPALRLPGARWSRIVHAYSGADGGQKTKPHKLKTSEVYFILSGTGLMHIDEEYCEVNPLCAVYIPPHATQYIENIGVADLDFLCIVDPAWRKEDEEVLITDISSMF